jgi:hypothetical protein
MVVVSELLSVMMRSQYAPVLVELHTHTPLLHVPSLEHRSPSLMHVASTLTGLLSQVNALSWLRIWLRSTPDSRASA